MERGRPVPIARLTVVACALLVLAGCGVGPQSPDSTASPTVAAEHSGYPVSDETAVDEPAAADVDPAAGPAEDVTRTPIGHDVVLTVTAPTTFTPTDTAYPRVSRAIALDMVIENGGMIAFRPAQLAFTATVDGAQAEQVIDSTQGYNGVSSAAEEIAPNQTLRFTVAFGVPEKSCTVRVEVRPDSASTATIELYTGVV
jgi:hypothetical protein